MAYITAAEVRAELLTGFPEGEVFDAALARCIARAEAEVDARLAHRYTVPFSPVPPLVRSLVGDLAAEGALMATPGANAAGLEKIASGFRERAERMLDALADGDAVLPGSARTGAALGVWHRAASTPVLRDFSLYREP